jgi:FMN phosphatase YigB (HAD superfamily)
MKMLTLYGYNRSKKGVTMKQKTIVFDFGGVLFETSATDFYRDWFTARGRSEENLNFFLKNIFTKFDRSAANVGTMQEILSEKVKQYPEWAEEILAFGADREFVKQVIQSGERMNMPLIIEAYTPNFSKTEPIAKFVLTLSLKVK